MPSSETSFFSPLGEEKKKDSKNSWERKKGIWSAFLLLWEKIKDVWEKKKDFEVHRKKKKTLLIFAGRVFLETLERKKKETFWTWAYFSKDPQEKKEDAWEKKKDFGVHGKKKKILGKKKDGP